MVRFSIFAAGFGSGRADRRRWLIISNCRASITPAVKAACESDVRRYCVDSDPSFAKVKACVIAKFGQFGTRCKMQAAMAGLKP